MEDSEFSLNGPEECSNHSSSSSGSEDLVSEADSADRASSWSLNSNCSSTSAKSRETNDCTSPSSEEIKSSEKSQDKAQDKMQDKTSQTEGPRSNPVEIPSPSKHGKERESETLSRSDSWQFVFYSGSNCDNIFRKHSNALDPSNQKHVNQSPKSRYCTDTSHKGCQSALLRKTRLQEVRRCFFEAYSAVIFTNENKVPLDTLSELAVHFSGALSIQSLKRIKTPN